MAPQVKKTVIPKEKDPNRVIPQVKLTQRGEMCAVNSKNRTLPKGAEKYAFYFNKFIWPETEVTEEKE